MVHIVFFFFVDGVPANVSQVSQYSRFNLECLSTDMLYSTSNLLALNEGPTPRSSGRGAGVPHNAVNDVL